MPSIVLRLFGRCANTSSILFFICSLKAAYFSLELLDFLVETSGERADDARSALGFCEIFFDRLDMRRCFHRRALIGHARWFGRLCLDLREEFRKRYVGRFLEPVRYGLKFWPVRLRFVDVLDTINRGWLHADLVC